MHDINRTQLEMEWETEPYGAWEYETEYGESEFENSLESYDEFYGEMAFQGPFSEAEEMELAAELLGITDEDELDQFLGNLFKKVGRKVGRFVRSPVGRALGGTLKGVAKSALPMAGAALGNILLPGVGGVVGGNIASAAGKLFGLELEGMSPEDQEFEVARRYVRLASDAAIKATAAPPGASPQAVAQQAIAAAAQKHAPGLVGGGRRQRRGVWKRQGRNIVLYGV